jgi:hypothetical protein
LIKDLTKGGARCAERDSSNFLADVFGAADWGLAVALMAMFVVQMTRNRAQLSPMEPLGDPWGSGPFWAAHHAYGRRRAFLGLEHIPRCVRKV